MERVRGIVEPFDPDIVHLLHAIRAPSKYALRSGVPHASMDHFAALFEANGTLTPLQMAGVQLAGIGELLPPELAAHIAQHIEQPPLPARGRRPNPAVDPFKALAHLYIGCRVYEYRKAILHVKPDFGAKRAEESACAFVAAECTEHGASTAEDTITTSYKVFRRRMKEGYMEHLR